MAPAPDPVLVAELASCLRGHARAGGPVSAEWSQVGAAHSGRIYVEGARSPLPPDAVAIFQKLRAAMVDPGRGAWFSARLELPPGAEPVFEANYSQRVFWNSPDLLTPPEGAPPVPTDEEWAGEMQRHPRAPAHVPPWLTLPAQDSGEFALLRSALERAGFPRPALRLPGETHATFEGAVLVRRLESVFSVDIFDYGQLHHLGTEASERAAGLLAWNYVTAHLPQPLVTTTAELHSRAQAAATGYRDLAGRIAAAGPGGVLTNLPVGVPFDKWGGLDGLYVWAWGTPLEQRSLPPTATEDGAEPVGFVANGPIPVQAQFTPPWFDQPGGGIRFRVRLPLRDLVRAGALSVVKIAA